MQFVPLSFIQDVSASLPRSAVTNQWRKLGSPWHKTALTRCKINKGTLKIFINAEKLFFKFKSRKNMADWKPKIDELQEIHVNSECTCKDDWPGLLSFEEYQDFLLSIVSQSQHEVQSVVVDSLCKQLKSDRSRDDQLQLFFSSIRSIDSLSIPMNSWAKPYFITKVTRKLVLTGTGNISEELEKHIFEKMQHGSLRYLEMGIETFDDKLQLRLLKAIDSCNGKGIIHMFKRMSCLAKKNGLLEKNWKISNVSSVVGFGKLQNCTTVWRYFSWTCNERF